MAKRDCYDVLGIPRGASKDDIKKNKKEIRKEVSDILFDIWVKRSSWGGK